MTRKAKVLAETQPYNVTITGRHVQITDAIKAYALEKLSKIDRFHDRIIDVIVTMDIQREDHRVDIQMKVNNIKIKAQATTNNMYASIDQAVHKLQSQLRRYKQRIQDHQTHAGSIVNLNVRVIRRPMDDAIAEFNDEIEEENMRRIENSLKPHNIVENKTVPLKTLNSGEAIMKMELSGDAFLIYRDEANHKVHVIYRRDDENYGIIAIES
jgi:putative sigma-54 modulation protein